MPRCNLCDCSSEPSASATESCSGRVVTYSELHKEWICDYCLGEIYGALSDFEEIEPDNDMEGPEFLDEQGVEGHQSNHK